MIYFIRHAQTLFNKAQHQLINKLGQNYRTNPQYQQFIYDLKYEDASLTEEGYKQTIKCKEHFQSQDINLVIVSPLRRTIITCHEIFSNHKNKPPMIVWPQFRAILGSAYDIGSLLHLTIKEYPHFDYSRIKDIPAWYIHTITHPEYHQKLIKSLQNLQGQQKRNKATHQTLKIIKDSHSQSNKSHSIDQKKQIKQKMFPSLTAQKHKLKQLLKTYKQIAIVTHGENIKYYAGKKPCNCGIVTFKQEQL